MSSGLQRFGKLGGTLTPCRASLSLLDVGREVSITPWDSLMLGSSWLLAPLSPRQPPGPKGGAVGQTSACSKSPLPSTGPRRKEEQSQRKVEMDVGRASKHS